MQRAGKAARSYTYLLLILVGAFLLRIHTLFWDDLLLAHPDERHIAQVAASIEPSQPQTWNPFWNPGTGERRQFAYGQWPLYIQAISGRLCCTNPLWTPEQGMAVAGRVLSAWWGVCAVVFTFLLGRCLSGDVTGLLAAGLLAVAPLHVQNGHFGTFDSALTAWTVAGLWLLVRHTQTHRLRDLLLAGGAVGLAVGAKFSALPLVGLLLFVCLWRWWQVRQARMFAPLFLALSVFALSNPFALLEPVLWVRGMFTQASMVRGILPPGDFEYVRQFAGTLPWLYFVEQEARFALGLPLTVLCYAGLLWALWRWWHADVRAISWAVVLLWCWGYFALTGSQYARFPRYMMPLHPAMIVVAVSVLVNWWGKRRGAAVLIYIGSLLWGLGLSASLLAGYARPHPWAAASDWLYQNVPAGSSLLLELWDEPLPMPRVSGGEVFLPEVYTRARYDAWDEPDNLDKLNTLAAQLAGADYLVLASNRLYDAVPRWPERYPLMTAYYRALFGGALGFEIQQVFDRSLVPLAPLDESLTVYDRPQVILWRNVRRLDAAAITARIFVHTD